MQTTTVESPIRQKTKELCQAILEQPSMLSIRQRIDAFMGDEQTRAQYEGLVTKGQALQQKQQSSVPLTEAEIDEFQRERDEVLNNPVARGFIDAQEELHEVQHEVQQYVNKTIEFGRVPSDEEMEGESCCGGHGGGHGGCGCH